MGDSDIEIVLHNQLQAYYPGDTIVGRVVCTFNKEHTVRAIRIRYKGEAKTRWTVKHGKNSTTYTGVQLYFREQLTLLDGGENNIKLPAGVYDYPFSYVLPQQIPSSFHEDCESVSYSIKAVADFPWKFDYKKKLILNIVSPLNLNLIPGLHIELILPGCYRNIKIKFPITIGTVPLSGVDTNFPSASAPPVNNAQPPAPPSYSEALQAIE